VEQPGNRADAGARLQPPESPIKHMKHYQNNQNQTHNTNPYDASCDEPIPATVRMMSHEDVARAALTGVLCELGCDEVRVLTRIGERLRAGRRDYGPLVLSGDPRSFRSKEAREELEDALVYLACAWLKAELPEGTR
jgi:hypothetical protein